MLMAKPPQDEVEPPDPWPPAGLLEFNAPGLYTMQPAGPFQLERNTARQHVMALSNETDAIAGFTSERVFRAGFLYLSPKVPPAVFGAEAVEYEGYMINRGDGIILVCGNGTNNLIAAQIRLGVNGERFFKIFTSATTTDWIQHGTQIPSSRHRIVFRLERHGNEGRIYFNRGGAHQKPEYLFSTNVIGTNYLTFDSEMDRVRTYKTGIVVPNTNTYLTWGRWWPL